MGSSTCMGQLVVSNSVFRVEKGWKKRGGEGIEARVLVKTNVRGGGLTGVLRGPHSRLCLLTKSEGGLQLVCIRGGK